jgi:FAD synthetase
MSSVKKKVVMVFGTFDILHHGHINFFTQAKKYGNYLIVIVARDKNVRKSKGKNSKYDESTRLVRVRKLKIVNKAKLGDLYDKFKVISEEKPDVICLGYDQKISISDLQKKLGNLEVKAKVCRLKPYKPEIYKTSKLKK